MSDGGWVYFIQCDRTKRVKIGWALSPPDRCKELQCGSPTILRVVTAMSGTIADEFELHARFKRVRLHGEWFKMSAALRSFMGKVLEKHGASPWVPKPPEPPPLTGPDPGPSPQPTASDREWFARLSDWYLDLVEAGEVTFEPWQFQHEAECRRAIECRRATINRR